MNTHRPTETPTHAPCPICYHLHPLESLHDSLCAHCTHATLTAQLEEARRDSASQAGFIGGPNYSREFDIAIDDIGLLLKIAQKHEPGSYRATWTVAALADLKDQHARLVADRNMLKEAMELIEHATNNKFGSGHGAYHENAFQIATKSLAALTERKEKVE
jgi:hypothetical protein